MIKNGKDDMNTSEGRIASKIIYPQNLRKEKWTVREKIEFITLLVVMILWAYFFANIFAHILNKAVEFMSLLILSIIIFILRKRLPRNKQ